MVVWIIGLSGAGKTTVGKILFEQLRQSDPNWVLLDGDTLRDVWGDAVGHSIEGRALNAHRISNLCKLLDCQGLTSLRLFFLSSQNGAIGTGNNSPLISKCFLMLI